MFISDFRKSIGYILYERITSPLYGTWLFSWIIWNWEIFYITFFVSEEKLKAMKLDYIVSNYFDWCSFHSWLHLLILPLFSTIIIIYVLPHLSKYVYKYALKRKEEHRNIQIVVQKKAVLTEEDKHELYILMDDRKVEYENNLVVKDEEIKYLNSIISVYKNKVKSKIESKLTTKDIDNDSSNDPIFAEFQDSYSGGIFSFIFRNTGQEAIITSVDNQNQLGINFNSGVLLNNEKLKITINADTNKLPKEIYFKVHFKNIKGEEKFKSYTYLVGKEELFENVNDIRVKY